MSAMNEPKPFASLGPTLLARKGGARPAMRPQVTPLGPLTAHALSAPEDAFEDLGWNDMGEDHDDLPEAAILPLPTASLPADSESAEARSIEPEVRRQQRAMAQAILPRERAGARGRRAAFTLRLDAERHLKLRLASTIKGCSAQQLVTQALDQFLAGVPELDALAARVKRD